MATVAQSSTSLAGAIVHASAKALVVLHKAPLTETSLRLYSVDARAATLAALKILDAAGPVQLRELISEIENSEAPL